MNYKSCDACVHSGKLFDQYPCRGCNSNHEPIDARAFRRIDLAETVDAWEPNELARALIEHGRRVGIEEALAVANAHQGESVISLRMALKALLEAK